MTLTELEATLDAFGGDPNRWPAVRRAAAERLLATDPAARKALAEAKALDRSMAAAPLVSAERTARLADRILAATATSGLENRNAPAQRPAKVVALAPRTSPPVRLPDPVPAAAVHRPTFARRSLWQSAGLIAASLVTGIILGTSELAVEPARVLMEVAGVQSEVEQVVAALQGELQPDTVDEELL